MDEQNKQLPADADTNQRKEDSQSGNQEELDNTSREQPDDQSRIKEKVRNEQAEDSQSKREDMIPPEKEKQSGKWDKVDRQFPNLRK
jgi:hypothetical protein